jgi:hypothetical protein
VTPTQSEVTKAMLSAAAAHGRLTKRAKKRRDRDALDAIDAAFGVILTRLYAIEEAFQHRGQRH